MGLDQFNEELSKTPKNLTCSTIVKAWSPRVNLVSMDFSLTILCRKISTVFYCN